MLDVHDITPLCPLVAVAPQMSGKHVPQDKGLKVFALEQCLLIVVLSLAYNMGLASSTKYSPQTAIRLGLFKKKYAH